MFTGIIEELGTLATCDQGPEQSARLVVVGPLVTVGARVGDSIAVDGVCLTVAELDDDTFQADVMKETLVRTTLGARRPGSRVNLERAMRADWRLGGHIVSGHVDSTGRIQARDSAARWDVVRIAVRDPSTFAQIAVKGSVAVDGVSLTVTALGQSGLDSDRTPWFEVSLIPTTLEHTTLGLKEIDAEVNIETDVLAKYVQRLLERGRP